MTMIRRVLDEHPVLSIEDYEDSGGGSGLRTAIRIGPAESMEMVRAAGLRGRGGAGFPTGTKWQTIVANLSTDLPATVVVNAAEGEPGTFKDRSIIRANPYRVLEGALIAAVTIGADEVVVATKASFRREVIRLKGAAAEIAAAGWVPGISIDVVQGPSSYLFGEETALLEVVAGRQPFPRIAPPWRRGVDDIGTQLDSGRDVGDALAADNNMAGPDHFSSTPPALVNNTETFANVALILAHGADWYRQVGTADSPGTLVCTVTGEMTHHGVGEFAMGTPLLQVLEELGGMALHGPISAVLPGVSNTLITPDQIETPLSYEAMAAAGSGLGTGGFIVLDQNVDPLAVAHGISRFLAVESCGQCSPCKQDGKQIAETLERLLTTEPVGDETGILTRRLASIDTGARCFLATQHQVAIRSILSQFPQTLQINAARDPREHIPYLVAEITDIVDGRAVLDERQASKQPDWTYESEDSGRSPAEWLNQRAGQAEQAVEHHLVE